jgi:PAS domain S-box-containing protein
MDDMRTVGAELEGDAPVAATQAMMSDRRELALVAIERTRMPMVITDPRQPDAPIVLANQAFLDLTGYDADDVIGRNCRFLQGPETCPDAVRAIAEGLRSGGDVEVELLNYRKDGTTFVNQLAISPVAGDDGELLYYFGSQKDVTERRRLETLEETERRLLMEVDHRAMNAMAIVQSIVRMSRGETLEHYMAAVQGRVEALARAHRLLGNQGWIGASLADLIASETRSHAHRIAVDGDAVHITAKMVQPMALVFHELLSNALNHGSLRSEDGAVAVTWRNEGGTITLQWRETGGGVVEAPDRFGFGIDMIKTIIGRQLGGSASLDWAANGLVAELTVTTGSQHLGHVKLPYPV